MKEEAKRYLLSLGYSEAEVEETLANATEEDLKGLVPEVEAPKAKPKPRAKPKATPTKATPAKVAPAKATPVKVTPKQVTPVPAQVTPVPFDPIKEAMTVIEGEKEEKKNQVVYTITPVWKLTICSDVEKITFNAIKEELKSIGGKWSDEIGGFWFDSDPSNILY